MKKTFAFLTCLGLFTTLTAQKVDMQLLELNDITISKPVIMGKVGTHYMVYDQASSWPTLIYIVDSTFKVSNTARQYIAEKYFQFVPSGDNMYLIWRTETKDSQYISVSRLDEFGNDNLFQRSVCFFPKKNASPPLLITDINSNYFLFYSWITDTDKRMYLRAVVFDSAWNELTNITSPVDFDKTSSSITRPMLDAAGNIHFVVHDKLSNYHLSSTITLYTIRPQKNELLSVPFETYKQKFYNLSLQDDTAARRVNILGYYYDGQEKSKKGIASLRVPYEDASQKIKTQFYPFPQDFIDFLYKNVRHARKKENPAEYLHIREIYERDGRIITGNSLLDLASYQLTKESDIGKDAPPNKAKNELDRALSEANLPSEVQSRFKQALNASGFKFPVRIETEAIFTNPGGSYPYFNRTQYTQKAVYLSVDTAGVYQYKLLNNEPVHPLSEDLYEYPMVHGGNLIFLSNEARLTKDDQIKVPQLRLSFSTSDTRGNTIKLAEFDATNTIFYPPNQVATNEYLGLYTNFITKKQGIAFWSIKDTP